MESQSKRNYERTLYAAKKNSIQRGGSVEPADRGGEWPREGVGEALTRITSGNTTGKLLIRV